MGRMELRRYTHYSNLRSLNRINRPEDLIKRAIELGLAGIAITDHESLTSHVELAEMSSFWGQDISVTQIAVTNIDLSQCQLNLCGQKNNTLRMVLSNGLVLVKFQFSEDEFNDLSADNTYMICIISPQRNEWNGSASGKGIIDDFELTTKWIF